MYDIYIYILGWHGATLHWHALGTATVAACKALSPEGMFGDEPDPQSKNRNRLGLIPVDYHLEGMNSPPSRAKGGARICRPGTLSVDFCCAN